MPEFKFRLPVYAPRHAATGAHVSSVNKATSEQTFTVYGSSQLVPSDHKGCIIIEMDLPKFAEWAEVIPDGATVAVVQATGPRASLPAAELKTILRQALSRAGKH